MYGTNVKIIRFNIQKFYMVLTLHLTVQYGLFSLYNISR